MDITTLNHIHFVGIKGVGMTALALCAQDLGIKVTGSDVPEIFVTDETLKKRNIEWVVGFRRENLDAKPDLVVTTGAHGGLKNPEVLAAREMGIPVLTHAQALAEMAYGKETIAVCGVGGKTTTSAMIATIFDTAGLNPSFAIGVGDIPSLGAPGRYDKEGKVFIAEADEFAVSPGVDNRPRFSLLEPKVIVVTNIEHDHPDIYPTIDDTKKVFKEFFEKVPEDGALVANVDNENVRNLIRHINIKVVTYGFSTNAEVVVREDMVLNVPGRFNRANAAAAAIVARRYGVVEEKIKEGLKKFTGTKRRFEKLGEFRGALMYDDYAHTPNEIENTLAAAREFFPGRRIIAIFQPHTYSRTKTLFNEFAQSFRDADLVAIMDIYGSAREKETLGVSGKLLAEETGRYQKGVYFTGGYDETTKWVINQTRKGDIVLIMGAGDVFKLRELVKS